MLAYGNGTFLGVGGPNNATVSIAGTFAEPSVPGAPSGISAIADDALANVSWTAPASDGGAPILSYTVTSSPGSRTCTTTNSTSCEIAGLTNGTSYTFTVTALNSVGAGAASTPSSAVTPMADQVPGAPTAVTAVGAYGGANVSWTAPASDGGSTILGYTVTSSPGQHTCTTVTLMCSVSGLVYGSPYTFTVTANNAIGTGLASAPSNSLTPQGLDKVVSWSTAGSVPVSGGSNVVALGSTDDTFGGGLEWCGVPQRHGIGVDPGGHAHRWHSP